MLEILTRYQYDSRCRRRSYSTLLNKNTPTNCLYVVNFVQNIKHKRDVFVFLNNHLQCFNLMNKENILRVLN